jgi:hypothetical protein
MQYSKEQNIRIAGVQQAVWHNGGYSPLKLSSNKLESFVPAGIFVFPVRTASFRTLYRQVADSAVGK